jgi:hypothetical protein
LVEVEVPAAGDTVGIMFGNEMLKKGLARIHPMEISVAGSLDLKSKDKVMCKDKGRRKAKVKIMEW